MDGATPTETAPKPVRPAYVGRAAIVGALIGLAILLYKLGSVLLLIPGAVVVAVCIHLIADPLRKRLRLSSKLAAAIAIILIILAISGVIYFFGVHIAKQLNTFLDELPDAIQSAKNDLSHGPLGRLFEGFLSNGAANASSLISSLRDIVGNAMTALVYLVTTVSAGIVLSIFPEKYRDGALLLLPPRGRPKVRETANICGRALKGWLVGQLNAMFVIGLLTAIGLKLIGMPAWLILGLFAGFAQFVPLLGPFASAVPGLIVAASMSFSMFLWTVGVYVGVQQLESNFITPFVMRKTASLPMALTIMSIVAFSALFGVLGAILATPITVMIYIFVQKLYLEDAFGDDIEILGEK